MEIPKPIDILAPRSNSEVAMNAFVISQVMAERYRQEVLEPWEVNWRTLMSRLSCFFPHDLYGSSIRWRFTSHNDPGTTLGIVAHWERDPGGLSQEQYSLPAVGALAEAIARQALEFDVGGSDIPEGKIRCFGENEIATYLALRDNTMALPESGNLLLSTDVLYAHYEQALQSGIQDPVFCLLGTIVDFVEQSDITVVSLNGSLRV